MKLREAMIAATARLEAAAHKLTYGQGSWCAQQDAGWIVLRCAGLPVHAEPDPDRAITPQQWAQVETALQRRLRGEPAAYILREAYLGTHRFYVDERCIIPRSYLLEYLLPDTRFSAYLDQTLLQGRAPRRVLDLW